LVNIAPLHEGALLVSPALGIAQTLLLPDGADQADQPSGVHSGSRFSRAQAEKLPRRQDEPRVAPRAPLLATQTGGKPGPTQTAARPS
jgi:hypothetical protein